MTVEFVVLAPLLLILLLFLVLAGRVVEAHGAVDGAARDAARAASIARTSQGAQDDLPRVFADWQAVAADVHGWCTAPLVQGFAPGSPSVSVTLSCGLNLGFIDLGTVAINGYAVAPLDPFMARTY